jgi:Ca-activated chloride channel family protein
MRIRTISIRTAAPSPAGYLFAIISLLIASAVARAQQATPSPPPDDRYTISVSVDEVLLHATVRNRRGTPVAGLGKDDFQVFEDRVLQRIKHFSQEDIPVTVGLVIDNSGSMRPKREEVIAAALAFAGSSNPLDQMFLVNFNEHVSFGLPRNTLFTDQSDQLKAAMNTVTADGKTALYDAVAIALEHLKKGNRDKKVLIVVSDGADNASVHTKAQMLDLATKSDAIIYALGIYEPDDPENRNPHVLRELSKASGGEAFFPESLRDVLPICERIAREIRNQYTISYIPTNQKQDGTYRAIQVRAASPKGGGLAVTTRVGYVAPLKPAVATAGATRMEERN